MVLIPVCHKRFITVVEIEEIISEDSFYNRSHLWGIEFSSIGRVVFSGVLIHNDQIILYMMPSTKRIVVTRQIFKPQYVRRHDLSVDTNVLETGPKWSFFRTVGLFIV
ncbi:MAG: hypothetical protein ACXADB_12260 [Candidatus Hermodarchaeia archaeon]